MRRNDMEVNAKGTISKKEFLDANRYLYFRNSKVIGIIIGSIIGFSIFYSMEDVNLLSLSSLIIIIGLLLLFDYGVLIKIRNNKNYDNSQKLNIEMRWIISASGISIESESSNVNYKWNEFDGYKESKDCLFFKMKSPKGFYQIVPKRIINQIDLVLLKEFLKESGKKLFA
jgi:hypothetical protein